MELFLFKFILVNLDFKNVKFLQSKINGVANFEIFFEEHIILIAKNFSFKVKYKKSSSEIFMGLRFNYLFSFHLHFFVSSSVSS